MDQLVQIVGAILILLAYAGAQIGRFDPHAVSYLLLNLFGATILAVLAAIESQYGFLLLETVWTIVTAWSLWQVLRGRAQRA